MVSDGTVIIAFARLPVPGQVKTRLAAGIGKVAACNFYAACAAHVLHACYRCGVIVDGTAWIECIGMLRATWAWRTDHSHIWMP